MAEKSPGIFGVGWIDCGSWNGAHVWRWTPEAQTIPEKVLDLLKSIENPSILFNLDNCVRRIKTEKTSLYVATVDSEIVGALVVNINDELLNTIGRIMNIEDCAFMPGHAKKRWAFPHHLAKLNGATLIRTISSRPLNKVFKQLKPCEVVFYYEV